MIKKKRVATLCKAQKRVIMQTTSDNTQWIGDGGAMYILAGIEPMSAESLASMLDYSDKDFLTIKFAEIDAPEELYSDNANDIQIKEPPKRVIIKNAEYLIFETATELIFINGEYLKPIVTDDQTTYHFRTVPNGQECLCVKKGLLPEAVILGLNFNDQALNDWFSEIANTVSSVQAKYMTRRENSWSEQDLQIAFEEELNES